ncbi:MAG: hypothetical protein PG978_000682 [Wolbachia endosymbiont of Ctenocephalides felis wCfeF]|nr:MAG: hypothetical protein PG978_000682 [Wolbachia endosymbiont of Ctenocephalides felis wCfeF]
MINAMNCARIDLSKWVGSPPEKEFIIQDWLSIGDVSYLSGDFEVGKSLLVQQLMTAAATGKPWLNMDVKQVKAYGVFCTDEKEDLVRKQCAINKFYQLDGKSPDLNNIYLSSRVGEDNALIVFNDKYEGQLTPYFKELLEDIKFFQPKLVILDEDLDLFGGDEDNRCQRREFMQCCARIAKIANCAVLLCKQDANIEMWFNRAWYLSRSEEARDERIPQCRRSSHLLRYQDGVFVI